MMIAREIGLPFRGVTEDVTPGGGVGGEAGEGGTAGDRPAPAPGNTTATGTRTHPQERRMENRRKRTQNSLQPLKGKLNIRTYISCLHVRYFS